MKNCRNRGDTRTGPSGSVNAAKKPDDERTANIHDKGAEREKLTAAFSNESRHPESRSSLKCAAEDYQNITEHRKTPSCLEGVISSRGFLPHPREKANSIAEINSTAWRVYIDQTLTKLADNLVGTRSFADGIVCLTRITF